MTDSRPATEALQRLCRTIRDMVAVSKEEEKIRIADDLILLGLAILKYEPPLQEVHTPIMQHPDGPM